MDPVTPAHRQSLPAALPDDWREIASRALRSGQAALEAVAGLAGMTQASCARLVSLEMRLAFRDGERLLSESFVTDRVPPDVMRRRLTVLLSRQGRLIAVSPDPFDWEGRDWIAGVCHPEAVAFEICEPEVFLDLMHDADVAAGASAIPARDGDPAQPDDEDDIGVLDVNAPAVGQVVVLLNSLLKDALQAQASDIHLETGSDRLEVKLRIDGVLSVAAQIAGRRTAEQLISRIKVLSQLDIAERRRPQDGRFRVQERNRTIDLRVSIMPSIHGEDAVLRILDKSQLTPKGESLTLQALGFDPADCERLRRLVALPYGMLLVTGPTGSGKSTTLYAALSEIRSGREKIVTIEDPVEYELPGILQIPVNERKGLTFAVGLRSILRHDPDRIMVGEIRDPETADIAIQAALTGHLVLTTVHANNVFDVIGRLENMGADPYTIAASLNGIWAQRLLRRLCEQCAAPADEPSSASVPNIAMQGPTAGTWRKAVGCSSCRQTGYRGRIAVAEVLEVDDAIRELVAARAPAGRIKERAQASGIRSLRAAALAAARAGVTTLDEVLRVTRHD